MMRVQGMWRGYTRVQEMWRYKKWKNFHVLLSHFSYPSHICCTSTIPMSSFACPCCDSQLAAPILLLHSLTTIINVQPLSLSISLPPIDLQPRVLKVGWNCSLIFTFDILSSGFCWWASKALSCGPKLVHVGVKLHFLSLGLIGLCSFGSSMIGLYWRLFGIFFLWLWTFVCLV